MLLMDLELLRGTDKEVARAGSWVAKKKVVVRVKVGGGMSRGTGVQVSTLGFAAGG